MSDFGRERISNFLAHFYYIEAAASSESCLGKFHGQIRMMRVDGALLSRAERDRERQRDTLGLDKLALAGLCCDLTIDICTIILFVDLHEFYGLD